MRNVRNRKKIPQPSLKQAKRTSKKSLFFLHSKRVFFRTKKQSRNSINHEISTARKCRNTSFFYSEPTNEKTKKKTFNFTLMSSTCGSLPGRNAKEKRDKAPLSEARALETQLRNPQISISPKRPKPQNRCFSSVLHRIQRNLNRLNLSK